MLGAAPLPEGLHPIAAAWRPVAASAVVIGLLALAAWLYLAGVRRLHRHERAWSPARGGSFLTGLAVLAVATSPLLSGPPAPRFSLRVVQMLLLVDVAPTLLALGAPLSLAIEAARQRERRTLARVLGAPAASTLTHPALALGLVVTSTYGNILTPLYRLSLAHGALRALAEAELFAAGCLFWWLAVGPDRLAHTLSEPGRLLYLGLTMPPAAFLGIVLLDSSRPIGVGTLAETRLGGAILWLFASLYTLAAIAVVFVRWMQAEDRRERARDEFDDPVVAAERIVSEAAGALGGHAGPGEEPGR